MNLISKAIGWWRGLRWSFATKHDLQLLENKIIMKVRDVNALLLGVETKLDKAKTEILAEIQTLKDQTADADLPEDASATIARLAEKAQGLDDVVPDELPPTQPEA